MPWHRNVGVVKLVKPSSKIVLQSVPRRFFFCGSFVLLCLVFVIFCACSFLPLWSPAGKGLTSWHWFVVSNGEVVTFPCGILVQMWYLIVSIPDFCQPSYFESGYEASPSRTLPSKVCSNGSMAKNGPVLMVTCFT